MYIIAREHLVLPCKIGRADVIKYRRRPATVPHETTQDNIFKNPAVPALFAGDLQVAEIVQRQFTLP